MYGSIQPPPSHISQQTHHRELGTVGMDAVTVDNAVASYGGTRILKSLSMEVKQGTVYALLGPSGCGKTTLLSCILGRMPLKSGAITVYGGKPGDRSIGLPGPLVGFMPQDICLYQEFTIKETFQYFGRLQKLTKGSLEEKQDWLLDMLDLPEENRTVARLSGGQKRRLSFAVALLHDPKLLILDEPTVGVDPLVRARIWSHLLSLSHSGVTIIITTHYIEEARDANTVGFMREGRLLTQESPENLMHIHKTPTLEKVFLSLCCQDQQNAVPKDDDEAKIPYTRSPSIQSVCSEAPSTWYSDCENDSLKVKLIQRKTEAKPRKCVTLPSISNIAALFVKNWITMKRNLPLLFFVFFLPGIVLFINSETIGLSPKDLPIALINLESNCSDENYQTRCETNLLGCYFQQSLNRSSIIDLVSYSNASAASYDSKTAAVRGKIEIPADFSISLLNSSTNSGIHKQIAISLDMSDPQLALFIKKAITTSLDVFAKDVSSVCKEILGKGFGMSIIAIEEPTLGDDECDFQEFITPGMIALSIFFLAMALTSESFIAERSQGLLERSWIMGVLPVEILTSYILSQFMVMVVQAVITLVTVFLIFQLPCRGPIIWFAVLTLFQGLAGMSFGFFLSTVCNTSMDAMKMSIGSCFPHMLLCGIIWPLEGMQYKWMRTVAWFLPHTASVQGMRDIMLRGWGVEADSVLQGMGISAGWIVLFLGLSWLLVKSKLK